MKLTKYKLGEILDVTRGASLSGEFYATEGKYIRLTCGNFDYQNNCFKENKSKDNLYYVGDFKPEFLMEEGDIITPLTEQAIGLLGSTAIIPESGKYIQSQDVAKIICKEELLDKDFAFYLISSTLVKQQLSAAAQQTKIRHTSPDKIRDCTVWIPELAEQKRIGKLLRSLDRKIELNRAINQNLEAMAKQLYDYWFVQFDFPNKDGRPYKSSGGKMVWNKKIKREIPEGWKEVTLNDFIDKNKGGDWGYDTPKDGTIKVGCVRGADIIKLNDVPTRHITSKHSDRLLEDGDIVIEISGGSPVQATGRVALITNGVIERNGGALVCSNFCQSFNMKKREFSEYFYYLWQNLYDNDNMFNFEGKTSGIKNFQTDVFLANYWFEVPEPLIETFHTIVAQYHLMIDQNIIENNNLIKQRDKLLPLLMNGQVSVNSDLSVYKKKRRGRIPSLTLNQVSDIQILHRQSIVLLTKQVLMDELQSERLIILVIIPFGTEIFVPIAWHVLLEETSQVFQAFGLVLLEVAAHDDDAPVGEVASSVAVLPEADVAVQITLTDIHAKAVGILHHATTVSVAELLTQVEIEIKNQIFLFHN